MNKIIERNFSIDVIYKFLIIAFLCLVVSLGIFNVEVSTVSITIQLFLFTIAVVSILLIFITKGFCIYEGKIYKAWFLFGLKMRTVLIVSEHNKIITVLGFNRRDYYNFFTPWEPDLSYKIKSFELYLLDKNHQGKIELMSFKTMESANKAITFLIENSGLTYQKYSPV